MAKLKLCIDSYGNKHYYDYRPVTVSSKTLGKLTELKKELHASSFDEVVNILLNALNLRPELVAAIKLLKGGE